MRGTGSGGRSNAARMRLAAAARSGALSTSVPSRSNRTARGLMPPLRRGNARMPLCVDSSCAPNLPSATPARRATTRPCGSAPHCFLPAAARVGDPPAMKFVLRAGTAALVVLAAARRVGVPRRRHRRRDALARRDRRRASATPSAATWRSAARCASSSAANSALEAHDVRAVRPARLHAGRVRARRRAAPAHRPARCDHGDALARHRTRQRRTSPSRAPPTARATGRSRADCRGRRARAATPAIDALTVRGLDRRLRRRRRAGANARRPRRRSRDRARGRTGHGRYPRRPPRPPAVRHLVPRRRPRCAGPRVAGDAGCRAAARPCCMPRATSTSRAAPATIDAGFGTARLDEIAALLDASRRAAVRCRPRSPRASPFARRPRRCDVAARRQSRAPPFTGRVAFDASRRGRASRPNSPPPKSTSRRGPATAQAASTPHRRPTTGPRHRCRARCPSTSRSRCASTAGVAPRSNCMPRASTCRPMRAASACHGPASRRPCRSPGELRLTHDGPRPLVAVEARSEDTDLAAARDALPAGSELDGRVRSRRTASRRTGRDAR